MKYTLCLMVLACVVSSAVAGDTGVSSLAEAIAKKQTAVQNDKGTVAADASAVGAAQQKVNYDQTTTINKPMCAGCAIMQPVPFCQLYPQQCQTDNANLAAAQGQMSTDQQTLNQDSGQLAQLQAMVSGLPPPPDPTQQDPTAPGGAGPSSLSGGGLDPFAAQKSGGRARAVNLDPTAEDVAKLQGPVTDQSAAPAGFQAASMLASAFAQRSTGPDPLNSRISVPAFEAGASGGPSASLTRSAESKLMIGDFRGALTDSIAAVKADPKDSRGYQLAGQAYTKLKDYQDAEGMTRQALLLDPNNAEAWKDLALALVLAKQGRYKEALEAALTAVRLNPNLAQAWAIAAYAAGKLGDVNARLAYLQKAAALDPKYQAAAAGEDDDDLLIGEGKPRARRESPGGVPAAALAAGAALLALAGGAFAAWRLKRAKAPLRGPGLVLAETIGKYRLGPVIVRGGLGDVYLATDTRLGRSVSIRKLPRSPSLVARARAAARLRHPAVAGIYEVLESSDDVYVVSELARGKTVFELIAQSGRLQARAAAEILRPVCEALEYAHSQQLAHRAIKTENIIVTEEGYVKLLDFGLAPEDGVAGKEADVLALVATLREMVLPGVSPAVDALLAQARFGSAGELFMALRAALG